jgi:hypothetical protein
MRGCDPTGVLRGSEDAFRRECNAFIDGVNATHHCELPRIRDSQPVRGLMALPWADSEPAEALEEPNAQGMEAPSVGRLANLPVMGQDNLPIMEQANLPIMERADLPIMEQAATMRGSEANAEARTAVESEVEAAPLPSIAWPEGYSEVNFPTNRVVHIKPWTPYEEAVIQQWDREGRMITVVQLSEYLPGRETTQIQAKIRKLFKPEPIVPSGPRRIGTECAIADHVFRATDGGVRAMKFFSGVLSFSELEAADMLRKAEKRVLEFRALNPGDTPNPWVVVLLVKPGSQLSDIALLACLLSHVGGTFITKEARPNKRAQHSYRECPFVWPPNDEDVAFGFIFDDKAEAPQPLAVKGCRAFFLSVGRDVQDASGRSIPRLEVPHDDLDFRIVREVLWTMLGDGARQLMAAVGGS